MINFTTNLLHIIGSGAVAYIQALQIRDPQTRPSLLAGFQLAESGSVPFLEALSKRASSEGDEWLAEKLAIHASDEKRHGQIFAHGLKQLGKVAIDFSKMPKTPEDKEKRRSPFFEKYFDGYEQEDLKPEKIDWIVFIASTYILELDASKDFVRMANVLPEEDPTSRNLKKSILSIAEDETRHAAYLYEALQRRVSQQSDQGIIDEWRERKVKALFAMVGDVIQKGGKLPSLVEEGAPVEMETEQLQAA